MSADRTGTVSGGAWKGMEAEMDDRKKILERVMEATDATRTRVQQEVSQSPMVSATKERAQAVRQRAQTAALSQLHLESGTGRRRSLPALFFKKGPCLSTQFRRMSMSPVC